MRQLLTAAGLIFPLAIDTFALAGALGMAGLQGRDRLRLTAVFTGFEAAMPIAGMLAGAAAGRLIGDWAGYAAIGLIAIVGLLMLRPGRDDEAEEQRVRLLARTRGLAVVPLGLSISLDELSIGLSAGLIGLPAPAMIGAIAIQAFVATQAGLRLGSRLSDELRERSEWLAGAALLVVAAALLLLKMRGV